jgi:predicted GIY-YIG superfamily endonuclease
MREPESYFVYIMTNRSKTPYVGITNNLIRRVREHKLGIGSAFAATYRLDRLVYFPADVAARLLGGPADYIRAARRW